jgi:hypothetical protein
LAANVDQNGIPLSAGQPVWTCPQCQERWVSRSGSCPTCLYGMPGSQTLPLVQAAPVQTIPQPPAEVKQYSEDQVLTMIREVQSQAQTNHEQLLTQVSTMLKPLSDWFAAKGSPLPAEQLIAQTVRTLDHLVTQQQRTAQAPPSQLGELGTVLTRLLESIEGLRSDVRSRDHLVSQDYPSYLPSDQQTARLERELLGQQPWESR